jgi:hypothetical protein
MPQLFASKTAARAVDELQSGIEIGMKQEQ